MKARFLILPALMAAALLAQNGPYRARANSATPPTAAQLATRQLQMTAAFLGLDAAQTSTLVGNSGLVTELTADETQLQSNRTALQTAYTTLATGIVSAPTASPAAAISQIDSLTASSLQTRATAAGQIVAALAPLGLNSTQQGKVQNLVQRLADGGLGGGPGGFRGPRR